ncbi:MAG: DUF3768 domain-containing protein [Microcoleaceae cyanobacterium MO_207.B10]|nr:DUF3768 domain-containing protein [Microcoleaceae cyanobacterium MO_207.B10]
MSRNKQLFNQHKHSPEPVPNDVFKILSQSPVGTSTWNWILTRSSSGTEQIFLPLSQGVDLTKDYEPKFLLKMPPGKSLDLETSVEVTAKAGVFVTKIGSIYVAPLYVLFQLSGNNYIYRVWINHYEGDTLPSPLYRLQKMQDLSILLIADKPDPQRSIKIDNQINWSSLIAKIESIMPWDLSAFNTAKSTASSAQELWNRTTYEQVKKTTITKLNDRFRNGDRSLGDYKMSRQVLLLPIKKQKQLFKQIQEFDDFTPENDPRGEHDIGKVTMDGVEYIWKIDYLDTSMIMLSDEPADINKTTRILLVIRGDEY